MRLIDADFVKQKMNQTMDYQDLYLPIHFEQVLDESPTLSPDEVRGVGEWIVDSVASNVFRCSICGSDAPVCPTGGNEYKSRYCPNCGAKMEVSEDA